VPLRLISFLLAWFFLGTASAQSSLVLISIDGLRPDYVLEASKYGLRVPNLRRLVSQGSYAAGVRGVTPTVTYPSHTTILTGVSPARHGIYSNTTFDPLNKNQQGWYWYAEDIQVPTLWSKASDAHLTTANIHWPVSVGAPITYNLPQIWRTGSPDDRKMLRALATPGLLTELEAKLGRYADGIDETLEGDENRGRFAVYLIESKKPRFTTAYFTALDHVQHQTGPFSRESLAALERIDKIVGSIRAAAEKVDSKAVTAVISDHGFAKATTEVNLLVPFVSNGFIQLDENKDIRSWTATIWAAGGSGAVMLKDPGDRALKDRVEQLLRGLASDPQNGISEIIDAARLKALGGFPGASFLVALKPGFYLGANMTGPVVPPNSKAGGMHGYLPSFDDMRSSFFIAGKGIAAGHSLGEIHMEDIAPTLAMRLGVSLPADGKDLLGKF
jgi:predicted AlkP superfamily pyrophosphatase or phosphodiesterase